MGAAALARFAALLGPYLGRLFRAKPALLASLLAKLRTSGAVVGDSVGAIVDWVKKNPANAILLGTTLATLGHSIAQLFEASDEESANFKDGLVKIANASTVIDGMIIETGERSATLSLGFDNGTESKTQAARQVLKFAVGHFGGAGNAKLAHKYMQAFFEMPRHDVDFGLANFRLDDVRLTA